MDFKYLAWVILALGLIFLLWPAWQQNLLLFGFVVGLMTVAILYLLLRSSDSIETFQISGEAIQNVGSIFNNDQMIVKNFESTGNLKANNQIVNGSTIISGPMTVTGKTLFNGTVTMKDNLVSNKVSVGRLQIVPGTGSPVTSKILIGDGSGWQLQFCKSTGEPVATVSDNGRVEIMGDAKITGNLTVDGTVTAGDTRQLIGCGRYFRPAISWMNSCDNRGPMQFYEYNSDGSIAGHYNIGNLIK